jgi:pimeloyl-ACP methyl ester carboxylesterase
MQQGESIPFLDSCRMEPDHQYYISLPDDLHSGQKIPLIIVIDPHGAGFSAMQKFKDALKDLPVAIAGSNKLQNNYAGFEASLKHLHNDLLAKYPVDPQKVIVAGFSGGARMALYYGIKNPVHGIIMFGAGPGSLNNGFQQNQIYAVSGTRDFNFFEQYRPLLIDIPDNSKNINDYFRGMHNWPPERYIREAVVFFLREISSTYNALSLTLSEDFLEESDSLQSANDLFFAGKALEKAWYFAAGNRQKSISTKIDAFESNPEWIACQRKIETLLKSEERIKQVFAANLVDPDTIWWSKEVNSLITKIHDCSDPAEIDYYYRLKGFLGIYLYTQINSLLNSKNSSDLMDRLIRIYQQVEPDSEDLGKFKVELSQIRDLSR